MASDKGPLRRGQLIAPFGVGAMVVVRDGTSLIMAGLDHWYTRESGEEADDKVEFVFEEWRLQRELGVDEFRLPPEYRQRKKYLVPPNWELFVPALRFPRYHFCSECHRLYELTATDGRKEMCADCQKKGKKRRLNQVPVVAMCEKGHLQDFPWRDWVHGQANATCSGILELRSTGGASLAAQVVKCRSCGARRDLGQVMSDSLNVSPSGSEVIRCGGQRPWLGAASAERCNADLRGTLRSASNVYFGQVRSSIYLPRGGGGIPDELVKLLDERPYGQLIKLLHKTGGVVLAANDIRKQEPLPLQAYTDGQIEKAVRILLGLDHSETDSVEPIEGDDSETSFRRAEYAVLRTPRQEEVLRSRQANLAEYEPHVAQYFSKIMLIDRLRETRALAGFTRVYPETDTPLRELRQSLFLSPPEERSWLPGYTVYGEGIFLELNEQKLKEWESSEAVKERLSPLVENYEQVQQQRRLKDRPLGPRFVLMHTLAHLLMNRLTFECGYSSAALRERLYVSTHPKAHMAGILIYTAAGDSEGTMGGLVRMGKPGYLEPVIRRALDGAKWCSADPVCMELGDVGGQGVDSCNLAACHNCALVPETACEEFNHFLDRKVVVGDVKDRSFGYFNL